MKRERGDDNCYGLLNFSSGRGADMLHVSCCLLEEDSVSIMFSGACRIGGNIE